MVVVQTEGAEAEQREKLREVDVKLEVIEEAEQVKVKPEVEAEGEPIKSCLQPGSQIPGAQASEPQIPGAPSVGCSAVALQCAPSSVSTAVMRALEDHFGHVKEVTEANADKTDSGVPCPPYRTTLLRLPHLTLRGRSCRSICSLLWVFMNLLLT